ncbi:Protein dennd6a [Podochytrium sp. JEL0797]|nr:Protein dennd6a [Podochytrium sp. JEL0797]
MHSAQRSANNSIDRLMDAIEPYSDLSDDQINEMMEEVLLGSDPEDISNHHPSVETDLAHVAPIEHSGPLLSPMVSKAIDEADLLAQDGPAISKIYSGTTHSASDSTTPIHPNASTISPSTPLENDSVSVVDSDGFTYAYVYFRQKADREIRRGYFQKSLVILSPHAWHGFFPTLLSSGIGCKVLDALASEGDMEGDGVGELSKALMKELCVDIAGWPTPPSTITTDSLYQNHDLLLSVFGQTFQCTFPPTIRFPQLFDLSTNINHTPTLPETLSLPRERTQTSMSNPHSTPTRLSEPTLSSSFPSTPFLKPSPHNPKPTTTTTLLSNPGRIYSTFSLSPKLSFLLWELMILGEPLLIHSDTPKACSSVVWTLLELMKPVPFGGDFRPFFTLQDGEFRSTGGGGTASAPPRMATIVGVTNPVFEKVFESWPHKVKAVGRVLMPPRVSGGGASPNLSRGGMESPPTTRQSIMGRGGGIGGGGGNAILSGVGAPGTPPRVHVAAPAGSSPRTSMFSSFRGAGGSAPGTPARPGSPVVIGQGKEIVVFDAVVESVTTKYKPILTRDKKFLDLLSTHLTSGSSPEFLDNLLRRHFIDLTDRFLQPLNRHYEGLIVGSPVTMTLSVLRARPEVKPFQQDTFLETVKAASTPNLPVSSKKSLLQFYKQFLKSPNFASWLQHRSAELNREWRAHYMHVLCDSDVVAWGRERGRQEIECVDLLLRLKEEVTQYSKYFEPAEPASLGGQWRKRIFSSSEIANGFIPTREQMDKLRTQQAAILGLLPEGLRMMQ